MAPLKCQQNQDLTERIATNGRLTFVLVSCPSGIQKLSELPTVRGFIIERLNRFLIRVIRAICLIRDSDHFSVVLILSALNNQFPEGRAVSKSPKPQ